MSASVKYWRLPEEEADLLEYLKSLEPTVVFVPRVFASAEEVRWVSLAQGFASDSERLFITPQRCLDHARTTWIEGPTGAGYTVDLAKSPVLYYRRGSLRENRLTTTALTAEWTYRTADGKTILDHPADFIRWARKVMQWVRRAAPGWYQFKANRITPKAEAARAAGLELQP